MRVASCSAVATAIRRKVVPCSPRRPVRSPQRAAVLDRAIPCWSSASNPIPTGIWRALVGIERINSARSLNVTQNFNFNDDTGAPVDNGPVLPYIIGRATIANIGTNVVTNDIGVATTTMNYPVNQLGRLAAIWARGAGSIVQGAQNW